MPKYLGSANGWIMGVPTPIEMKRHDDAVADGELHDVVSTQERPCVCIITCKTCGISWSIDSGD